MVDHVVPRDVPVDHVVPHDVPVDHTSRMTCRCRGRKPRQRRRRWDRNSPYAAKTPDEKKFVDQPAYKDATYRGRIVKSVDGRAITFADGKTFSPAKLGPDGKPVDDKDAANDSDPYVGDLGMCVPNKDNPLWVCWADHHGQVVPIGRKDKTEGALAAPPSGPTLAATDMVEVRADLGDQTLVAAMVDTGCSFPLSLPAFLAEALVDRGLAVRRGSSTSTLADGTTQDVDMIAIGTVTVDGRTLHNVEAAVGPSVAPVLLGLGALNGLGPFKIEEGRLVFTGAQPT